MSNTATMDNFYSNNDQLKNKDSFKELIDSNRLAYNQGA
jgi:hypothetical protein